ncbi:hypothetical protein BSKO_00267 [Bryopsis sp. KO-2023]|nr:hypothetical protein BSKO_00267 [Bryopsis sp. KO-2023]
MRSARRYPKNQASTWKDKVREDCRRRAREQRDVWLGRLREARDTSLEKAIISSEIRGIVDAALAAGVTEPAAMSVENEIFEKDVAAPLNEAEYAKQINEFEEMLFTEFMSSYSDLRAEINRETLLRESDMELMPGPEGLLRQRIALSEEASSSDVVCPICRRAGLQLRDHTVSCPVDGFQIDLSMEGLGEEDFKQRLADAYRDHNVGCGGILEFRMDERFGTPNLFAFCDECNFLQVVVGRGGQYGAQDLLHPGRNNEDRMVEGDLFSLTPGAIFDIMEQLYSAYPDSHLKHLSKQQMEFESGETKTSLVYGELTFASLCSVLREALRFAPSDRDLVFYDLGSGAGKQVIAAALVEPRITVAKGIEIIPGMDEIANTVLSRLKTEFLLAYDFPPEKEIEFMCGDIFTLGWSDGNVLLLNSTCFSRRMMANVQEIILRDLEVGSVVITLTKKFTDPRIREMACLERRMTWGRAHVYIYQLG